MQMIGHDCVTANEPGIGFFPGFAKKGMCLGGCQDWLAVFCANGDENDDGRIKPLNYGHVNGMFPARVVLDHSIVRRDARCGVPNIMGRDRARPSKVLLLVEWDLGQNGRLDHVFGFFDLFG